MTVPVESVVNGLPHVAVVRSSSRVGLSVVQVVFDQGADISQARQAVLERLQAVQLPEEISLPTISPLASPVGTCNMHLLVVVFTPIFSLTGVEGRIFAATGAGNEILQPLATVVFGGLFTSTLLTLVVLSALYAQFGEWLVPTGVGIKNRLDDGWDITD